MQTERARSSLRPACPCQTSTWKSSQKDSWRERHAQVREQLGIPPDSPLWSDTHRLFGIPGGASRPRDVVDLACQSIRQKGGPGTNLAAYLVDVSQDGSRKPWAENMRSMTTGSCFYTFAFDRILGASEHLNMLGCPPHLVLQDLSESSMKDLSGEAFACPTTGVVILCLTTCLGDIFET